MKNNEESLKKYLGIGIEDINSDKLTELLVEAFVYHEGMADLALASINSKTAEPNNMPILWESFETNNSLAYAMRSILLKSSEAQA
jgi:hypothetical protein